LFPALGVGEGAVGLKIAVTRPAIATSKAALTSTGKAATSFSAKARGFCFRLLA